MIHAAIVDVLRCGYRVRKGKKTGGVWQTVKWIRAFSRLRSEIFLSHRVNPSRVRRASCIRSRGRVRRQGRLGQGSAMRLHVGECVNGGFEIVGRGCPPKQVKPVGGNGKGRLTL